MNFAEIEEDILQTDLGFTMGQLKKGGLGSRVRGAQVDEKTRVRMSKTLQKMVAKDRSYGGTTTIRKQVAGTASSVTFTPVQGLEIVNPNAAAAEKLDGTQTKYFGTTTQFINLAPLVPAPVMKKELHQKH